MAKKAIIRSGGQQFIVAENDEIIVQNLSSDINETIELETLGILDGDKSEFGTPLLKNSIKATVVEHMKGDKVRVAKFKAKVRYRRVNGFRPQLTRIKIASI